MKRLLPANKGFTLVELLVVISIIAVLSVVGLTVFTGVQKNARDAKRRADIDAISTALESHHNTTKDQYCTANAGTYCAPLGAWFEANAMPTDPSGGGGYLYLPTDGVTSYKICADLESDAWPEEGAARDDYCKSSQQ